MRADAVVIGGGIVGTLTAWRLRRLGLRVVLVYSGLLTGATTVSAAVLRTTCDEPVLAATSLGWYRRWSEQQPAGLKVFRPSGVVLVTPPGTSSMVRQARDLVEAQLPGAGAVPAGRGTVHGLAGGQDEVWLEPLSGYADPRLTVLSIVLAYAREGGLLVRTHATGVRREGHGWAVRTAHAETVRCDAVVVAAAGASTNLVPPECNALVPRMTAVSSFVGVLDVRRPDAPAVVDLAGGLLVRPHPGGMLASLRASVPLAAFGTMLAQAAATRLSLEPCACRTVRHGWMDVTPDGRPIVGAVDEGLHLACGFGGKGFKTAPAITQALAESVVTGRSSPVLRPFDPCRRHEAPRGRDLAELS